MKQLESSKKEKIKKEFFCRDWKEKNKKYINALDKFLDVVDNVTNEELKLDIIYKMLICDEILTKIVEEKLEKQV